MKRVLYISGLFMFLMILIFFGNNSLRNSAYNNLFDDAIKHTLRIYITKDEWLGLGSDIVDYQKIDDMGRTGNYRLANLEYEDKYGVKSIENIGIRTKGNTSRLIPDDGMGHLNRAHFKLKFGDMKDESQDKRLFLGMKTLYLKSDRGDDPAYIGEDYSYDLLNQYNIITSKSSFASLEIYVDDELIDFGLYTIIEPIDEAFLTKRYGSYALKSHLYKCLWQNYGPATLSKVANRKAIGVKDWKINYRPTYDLITSNDVNDFSDLLEFIDQLSRLNGEELEDYLIRNFEIYGFLDWLALNVSLGMPDDYWAMGNNYYLYFNQLGKIEFIPYDYDSGLGTGWDGSRFGGYKGIATSNIYLWNNTASKLMNVNYSFPLVEKVLDIERFQIYYENQFSVILEDGFFAFDTFKKHASLVEEMYKDELSNYENQNVTFDLEQAKWYFETRIESLKKQLDK